MNAKKIATSLPATQYAALERARKRLRMKRSDAVQQALAMWLAAQAKDPREEQCIRGYLKHPDPGADAEAMTRAWVDGLEREDSPPQAGQHASAISARPRA
jgi:hypothetical protein